MTNPDRLKALVERATARLNRRRHGDDPWQDPLFSEAAYLQDRLMMMESGAASSRARQGIEESVRLARIDLDLPYANERDLNAAIQRKLK